MGFQLPDSAFPPLEFSPEEEQALVDLADRIVAETLQLEEDFIADHRRLSKQEWKLIKSREHIQVYKQRKVKEDAVQRPRLLSGTVAESHNYSHSESSSGDSYHHTHPLHRRRQHQVTASARSHQSHSTSSSNEHGSDDEGDSVVEKDKPRDVPIIVAHGIIPGTVEDVAFGTLAHTKYTWRLRNSYVKNNEYDDHKILATIHTPTEDDPFRFLGIKWVATTISAFMSNRDFVYIEATGMALDSNGDRVAYELIHPVELKQIPELQHVDVIRGKFSKCVITRQYDASSIEMYCRTFLDLGGEIIDSVRLNQHAENVLTIPNVIECSYIKKLTWQMQRNRRANSQAEKHAALKHCEVCEKSLRNLGNLFQSGLSCQICRKVRLCVDVWYAWESLTDLFCWASLLAVVVIVQMMCGKCSVEKKVTVDIAAEVTQKALAFCLPCVITAKKLSAWDIAIAELGR